MSAVPKSRSGPRSALSVMTPADLEDVVAVENAAYVFPWTLGNFRDSMRSGYECRVYRQDGEMAGYFVLMTAAEETHLLNLCVAPDRQRRGIGRYLLEQALVISLAQKAQRFFLEVRPSNEAARMLYAHAGFSEIGMRRDYYPALGGREDALVLQLEFE
jgi:ribosomal-protein-alanine N-acetyltransferase